MWRERRERRERRRVRREAVAAVKATELAERRHVELLAELLALRNHPGPHPTLVVRDPKTNKVKAMR